jgi:hypothetical protein
MFFRRLVPLVAALTVALAPVALDACQTTCAASVAATKDDAHAGHHDMHHGGSSTEHSCHHPVAPVVSDATVTVTGVPHSCGHTDTLPPTSLAGAQHMLTAPGVVPTPWVLTAPSSTAAPRIDTTTARDSIPIAAPLPLRV